MDKNAARIVFHSSLVSGFFIGFYRSTGLDIEPESIVNDIGDKIINFLSNNYQTQTTSPFYVDIVPWWTTYQNLLSAISIITTVIPVAALIMKRDFPTLFLLTLGYVCGILIGMMAGPGIIKSNTAIIVFSALFAVSLLYICNRMINEGL